MRRGRSGERARARERARGRPACFSFSFSPSARYVRAYVNSRDPRLRPISSAVAHDARCHDAARRDGRDVLRGSAAFPGVLPAHDAIAIAAARACHCVREARPPRASQEGGWMEPRLGRSASRSRRASGWPGRGRLSAPTPSLALAHRTHTARRTRASCVCTCVSVCASEAARAARVPFRVSSPRRRRGGKDPADRGFADSQIRKISTPVRSSPDNLERALNTIRCARALRTPGTGARLTPA